MKLRDPQETYYQAQTITQSGDNAERFDTACGVFLYTLWQIQATLAANRCRESEDNVLDTYSMLAEVVDGLNDETRAATVAALRGLADSLEARELG